MIQRTLTGAVLALLIVGCSGAPAGTSGPGATGTPGTGPSATSGSPTTAPGVPTAQPNSGDVESKARALMPPGATETGELSVGGLYQLYGSTTMTIEQLEAFWTQAIPAAGMNLLGKFTSAGQLTMSFENPDGGIIATPQDGAITFVISAGTSS